MAFGKEQYREINELLNAKFEEKKVLICAHRGSWHGNVIQNTTMAYKAALMQGADIVETDTTASYDGEVFSIHDGVEPRLFGWNKNSAHLSADQISAFHPLNGLGEPSSHHIQKLEEVFDFLCHDELINIDRTWRAAGKVPALLDQHPHMLRQAILKAPLSHREILDQLENHPVKYMFMPICYSLADVEEALAYRNLNMVGVELIAFSNDDELFSDEAIRYIHSKNLFTWVNALTLTDVPPYKPLYGDLDDDISILEGPDRGWGRLFDKQIDVIQTDWPALVKNYRFGRIGC
ncbi:MAG: glycerophosphodiester phosphodiesterase family protein [Clostridia bacterium]|nr:glycerophosphodiester phosphodiesterase family protein [Clostridia bacterium]MBQ2462980.1 glycerophosphodiester phosphodiesterase family protein [Clostridia bacterium]MBQ9289827.1 glycerophosphodiester phosphodiesterase family protein [Clostridia bacterium]MBR0216436.1 glycerophosphodiester phosphodiesterase family protein [Clostridia bacterium]